MEGPSNGGLLYHEVQESKLCAVHCVNTVLQGPFFSEFDLAALASDLDRKERQMLLEGDAVSDDFLRFDSEGSHNVSMDGDFSIQIHTKKMNRLEHQRLNDLVYIQYNCRFQAKFQERKEQNRNYNPLLFDELNWSSEWMIGESDDELVHLENDFTWRNVDRALGASSSYQGHNKPRRAPTSTSGSNLYYTQCNWSVELEDSSDEKVDEMSEEDVRDDENIEDDYGIAPNDVGQQQNAEEEKDFNLITDLD
ncbi:uncharacterized protein LOC122062524 isoform X2 [Macadamia integrifolia]|uniref:uncharacterized protein LOC122062524 isoform X2 n=1 Tax=Macadamia integrifolia TaxID=60698 RepID=UPI001C4FF32D|nr:uncharacterized protein LOC122062524 isoform X2 [Macadamia integrifolia]